MPRTSTSKATPKATATKASAKARPAQVHPPFVDMIVECIVAHRDDSRAGVSRPMIKKFLEDKYKIDITPSHITNINRAIARGAETNVFTLPKGPSGKVRLAPKKSTVEGKENHPPAKKTAVATKKASTSTSSKKPVPAKAQTSKKATSTTKPKAKPTTTKSSSARAKSSGTAKSARTKAPVKAPAKASAKAATTKAAPAKPAAAKKASTTKKAAVTKKTPTPKPAAKPKKTTSSTTTAAKAKASGTTSSRSGRSTRGTTTSSRGTKRVCFVIAYYLVLDVPAQCDNGGDDIREAGTEGARIVSVEAVGEILDILKSYGYHEIDTARVYTNGTSEELLGEADWKKRGLVVETKLYPSGPIKHTPEGIREYLGKSLDALKTDSIELFYLHAPDRSTPFEVTFKAVDELHKEGKFAKDMNVQPEAGSRFDPNRPDGQSKNYRARYWSETHFRALSIIEKATKEHQLTIAECALRWINHHSLLKAGYGDAIIIGASSKDHVESNLGDLEKGPLPAPVVEALDEAWEVLRASVRKYWH
ncbi:aldo/keto reductase family protein [Rhizoctonia solani]|uniref:Histone H1 n=1 Tax=Rhizoctonia solani TaxID=456999 RepID=A0A8H8T3Q8_9AGAM|nr:aldo/keto reductase family protein [Rhizoctonia solani]QRW27414.1 aldo/keto reductase family protein [Rhizoctonia solani]